MVAHTGAHPTLRTLLLEKPVKNPNDDVDAIMARLDQLKLQRLYREFSDVVKLCKAAKTEVEALLARRFHLAKAIRQFQLRGVTVQS